MLPLLSGTRSAFIGCLSIETATGNVVGKQRRPFKFSCANNILLYMIMSVLWILLFDYWPATGCVSANCRGAPKSFSQKMPKKSPFCHPIGCPAVDHRAPCSQIIIFCAQPSQVSCTITPWTHPTFGP